MNLYEGVWIFIAVVTEWLIMQRTLQSYRKIFISTSSSLAARSSGCQRPGETGNRTREHQAATAMRTWSWELAEVLHSQVSPKVESLCSSLGWERWVLAGGEHLPDKLFFASWWTTPSCCLPICCCKSLGKYSCITLILQHLPIWGVGFGFWFFCLLFSP